VRTSQVQELLSLSFTPSQDPFSCGSAATVPHKLAWLFGPGQFAGLTGAYSEGAGNAMGPTLPYVDLAGTVGAEL